MNNKKIAILEGHRVKKFEKEIRRFLETVTEYRAVSNETDYTMRTYPIYLFKHVLDLMHEEDLHSGQFPIEHIIVLGTIFTLRNLKTNTYQPKSEYMQEEVSHIIDNHESLSIWIYDAGFLHKPHDPALLINCAINKKKRGIIPIQYNMDMSLFYPKWFKEPLRKRKEIEVGKDFEIIDIINKALE